MPRILFMIMAIRLSEPHANILYSANFLDILAIHSVS